MLRVRLFVHVHPLILVYYVFPPISKMCANSFFDRSCMYAAQTLSNALDLCNRLLLFDAFKKNVKTHFYLKYFVN